MARTRIPSSPLSDNNSKLDQDKFLPVANVSRIMKKSLPANAKISKEAKETVQECVSEFISFVTGEASDKCQREKRKTINGDDLLWAMTTLGFEDYVGPLKGYLSQYRESEGDKISSMAREDDRIDHDGERVFTAKLGFSSQGLFNNVNYDHEGLLSNAFEIGKFDGNGKTSSLQHGGHNW